jgi:hypothetical protein
MTDSIVTGEDLVDMVNHSMNCPPNGYLGSDYGNDLLQLLQQPMRAGLGDKVINKLFEDVPILTILPDGVVDLELKDKAGVDSGRVLYINLAGVQVALGNVEESNIPSGTA